MARSLLQLLLLRLGATYILGLAVEADQCSFACEERL